MTQLMDRVNSTGIFIHLKVVTKSMLKYVTIGRDNRCFNEIIETELRHHNNNILSKNTQKIDKNAKFTFHRSMNL